jgi:hypothetical protein
MEVDVRRYESLKPAPHDTHHFAYRVIQEAWDEATAAGWIRRAELYEWARPRPGDFVPTHVTTEERTERYERLTELANACRARATLAWHSEAELRAALDDEVRGHAA